MSSLNLDEVLTKIEELRSLFELGQRTMPFLEELFHFLEEIEPLLDEINASIRESTNKMPDAKSKLESVSEATEMATTEILDLVDSVAFELKMMQRALARKTEGLDAVREADERLLHLLTQALSDEHDDLLDEVERIHRRKQPLLDEAIDHADDELAAVSDVQQKMTQITMALQVQDITSQQIAAANHIIESLRDRMAQLVYRPGLLEEAGAGSEGGEDVPSDDAPPEPATESAASDAAASGDAAPSTDEPEAEAPGPNATEAADARSVSPMKGDGTFDGNARYEPTGDHQTVADELISSIRQKVKEEDDAPDAPSPTANDDATPDDTALSPSPDPTPDTNRADTPPDKDIPDLGGDGEIAQEDIDELFG